ncbi:MAG: hypothetical protein LBJ82_00280 [Deltaproteobacteria bacterium]|jgi:hypothetical protein|nr:hypothetical protein [Deltaproteobacteria bacterium]
MSQKTSDLQQTPFAALGRLQEFWEHWGFALWSYPPFAGVSRRQHFVKSGILGRIAEFKAMDYIVLDGGTEEDREDLWRNCRPLPDIMTQRFLFVLENPWPGRRIRSFVWGFKGYLEFYAYKPGGENIDKIQDLTGLIELGFGLLRKTAHAPPPGSPE